MTSKYQALEDYLREKSNTDSVITLDLDQIEVIIGGSLPLSAYQHREWWFNQTDEPNRPQAKAWIEAGYQVTSVAANLPIKTVRFERR
jgi:hypothetical protein